MKPAIAPNPHTAKDYAPNPTQSVALLQELHILTREGKLNQDSRRKLKQIQHLVQFIRPLLEHSLQQHEDICLVDHGAGKSYLGFLLYDLFFKLHAANSRIIGIEQRAELVEKSQALAGRLGFEGMTFIHGQVADTLHHPALPARIDIVTALHACDTATDDAMDFAFTHEATHIVLVPCCQAQIAAALRAHKKPLATHPLSTFWQHPIHAREFGSHLTNVLRCLRLEARGYDLTVTELVGWEHSMKNELLIATRLPASTKNRLRAEQAQNQLAQLLTSLNIPELSLRFNVNQS